ncbi:MAG: protein translocase subunit SecD [Anaerolineales bacterium]|nr:protein translocase subunit SecD [Anaerolineales bacterium]
MSRFFTWMIVGIMFVAILVVNIPQNILIFGQETRIRQGLDLQGGLQILLEADLPADQAVPENSMEVAANVIDNRVNALGVSEAVVQVSLPRRIVVELPGYDNPEEARKLIQNTGLLEFVATEFLIEADTTIATDYLTSSDPAAAESGAPTAVFTPTLTITPIPTVTPTFSFVVIATEEGAGSGPVLPPTPSLAPTAVPGTVYHTIMTGADLQRAEVGMDPTGQPSVDFLLTDEGAKKFAEYTTNHVGWYLAIVLDKKVISCPTVSEPILGGSGTISGQFTAAEAKQLAILLSYGAMPVPLKIVREQIIGPTLGQDSLRRSLTAGAIGLLAVVLFMLLYYRLPGALADVALVLYAFSSLTIYRLIPVTFSLPGIAGFILSVGMAVDANVLIFERMKEELRSGKVLREAVDMGFSRAWPSIRDSNISTLITCLILIWFGGTFGASIVKGFAITLAVGVLVSMFTAILFTRNLLHLVLDRVDFSERHSWFGIADEPPSQTENSG